MSERMTGVVKWFNNTKGYGFIETEAADKDVFVHFRSILGDGYKTLKEGEKVEFIITEGNKGAQAEEVKRLGGD